MNAKPRPRTGIIVVVTVLIAVSVIVLGALIASGYFLLKSGGDGRTASFAITYSLTGLQGDETVSIETSSYRSTSLVSGEQRSTTEVVQATSGPMLIDAVVLAGKAATVIVEGTSAESAHCEVILDADTDRPRRLETTTTVADGKLMCSTHELSGTFR